MPGFALLSPFCAVSFSLRFLLFLVAGRGLLVVIAHVLAVCRHGLFLRAIKLRLPAILVSKVIASQYSELLLEHDLSFLSHDSSVAFELWQQIDIKLRRVFVAVSILSILWWIVAEVAVTAKAKEISL